MSVRIYLLLDVVNGKQARAMELLKSKPGVKLVDSLENSPDLIAVIEAPSMALLGEAIMPVIDCIDGITQNLKILIGEENSAAPECNIKRGVKVVNNGRKRSGTLNQREGSARLAKEMAHA